MNKPPDEPTTVEEFLWYVMYHEDRIFVREKMENGKFYTTGLSSLSSELWAKHVARWLDEGRIPCRVLTEEEQEQRKQQTNATRPTGTDSGPNQPEIPG